MGKVFRQLFFRQISQKGYMWEAGVSIVLSWSWINDRIAVFRGGHLSIMIYVECGFVALCLLKWLMDMYQRSVRIGMSCFGATVFSIIAAVSWISYLIIKTDHLVVLGLIVIFIVGQLLLIVLPEAGRVAQVRGIKSEDSH
jgi:hypothetical protein